MTEDTVARIAPSPDAEEDDYMSMVIPEPTAPKQETSAQRRVRKQREAEIKGRVKSKADLAAESDAARDVALSTSLSSDSKGFKMLSKLGFKPGSALGSTSNLDARLEPVGVEVREGRGGIGLDTEKKRKFREEAESETKRVKAEEGEYRERVRLEREERRTEGLLKGAMSVAERMDAEGLDAESGALDSEAAEAPTPASRSMAPNQVNILYRSLVRQRAQAERDRRMRYDLQQSLSRNKNYAPDPDEDEQDRMAVGREEEEVEEDDAELDDFEALEAAERLARLVGYLRDKHRYCFWCKYTYPDREMDGCPGLTEEDHD